MLARRRCVRSDVAKITLTDTGSNVTIGNMSVATEPVPVDARVKRLSAVSLRQVIEPDTDLPGALGDGQLIPDELMSVASLDLALTPEQRLMLSREQVASVTQAGIRFEAILMAGLSLQLSLAPDLTDPRMTYLLHEVGEETRHSRLFIRLVEQIRPVAKNPLLEGIPGRLAALGIRRLMGLPSLLYTLVLAGEEIPDLIQKQLAEHPETDPFLAQVNRYHRQEEARHLAFARMVLPEMWAESTVVERIAVRRVAPLVIGAMFDFLVHPGVYAAVGLPGFETWRKVRRSPSQVALRYESTRPVLKSVMAAGALRAGRVPAGWRRLCGVDRAGDPVG